MKVTTIQESQREDFEDTLASRLSNEWQHLSSGCSRVADYQTGEPMFRWWAVLSRPGEQD